MSEPLQSKQTVEHSKLNWLCNKPEFDSHGRVLSDQACWDSAPRNNVASSQNAQSQGSKIHGKFKVLTVAGGILVPQICTVHLPQSGNALMDMEAEQGNTPSYHIVPDPRDDGAPGLIGQRERKGAQRSRGIHNDLVWH